MSVRYYLVGGSVRDKLMGVKSNDLDYAVEADSFNEMKEDVLTKGGYIFLERPEFLTIRGRINGVCADYTMCRADGFYADGRRPDSVTACGLELDLARRDFTCNAIAMDSDGNIIDPFNGVEDIKHKMIRCVGTARDRLDEDALRMLRAIRFSITKGFKIDMEIKAYMWAEPHMLINVSYERIREELHKCFSHDTLSTLLALEEFDGIRDFVFSETNLWLKPSSESK
jgi:tRNA nucleotidyltransferase (CCA-adding enzyme)